MWYNEVSESLCRGPQACMDGMDGMQKIRGVGGNMIPFLHRLHVIRSRCFCANGYSTCAYALQPPVGNMC